MLDVLMLAQFDYANTGYRFSKCLELLGLNVLFYKGGRSRSNHPKQGEVYKGIRKGKKGKHRNVVRVPSLRPLVEKAKVIHFIASVFVNTGADLSKKKVVVQHGGSRYRQGHERLNQIFNPIANASIIQMPELMGLGAKNETYVAFPVDTGYLQPDFKRKDCNKLLIGHFPTSTVVKGTGTVLEAIQELEAIPELRDRFEYVGTTILDTPAKRFGVSWEENLDRVRRCDVVIDGCKLKQGGETYGEWGNAAFEAAALGTIPITHSLKVDFYESIYGECPMYIANSKDEIVSRLKAILMMSDEELLTEKKMIRDWIVEKHSLKATAKRLWDEVYCKLLGESK